MRVKVNTLPGLVEEPFHVTASRNADGSYTCTIEETGLEIGTIHRDGKYWRDNNLFIRHKTLRDAMKVIGV